jgi:hypothetical protein
MTRPDRTLTRPEPPPSADLDGDRHWGGGGPVDRIGVFEAIRWYWGTVLLSILVFAGAGVALGLARHPSYSADSRLEVRVAAHTPEGLPAAVAAAQDLASTYARQLESPSIQKQVAKASNISKANVAQDVSATPITGTAIVKVSASAPTGGEAVALANNGGHALHKYVERRNSHVGKVSAPVVSRAQAAIRLYQRRLDRQQKLQGEVSAAPSHTTRQALKQAKLRTQEAGLERNAAQQAYTESQLSYTAPLQTLSPAGSATSDRQSMIQILALIGAAAGLAIGAALATWRANRLVARSPES